MTWFVGDKVAPRDNPLISASAPSWPETFAARSFPRERNHGPPAECATGQIIKAKSITRQDRTDVALCAVLDCRKKPCKAKNQGVDGGAIFIGISGRSLAW